METKKCFKCGIVKTLDEFYKHSEMKDGHLNKCKECAKEDVANDRIKNPEKFKERDRKRDMLSHRVKARKEYIQSSKGKKVHNKATRKWKEKNPLKRLAHQMVKRAIKTGRLKKQPCEKCGSMVKVHAHHDDYYKPLEVKWLCPKCHTEFHKENL